MNVSSIQFTLNQYSAKFNCIIGEHYLEIILRLLGIRRWWHLRYYFDYQRLF